MFTRSLVAVFVMVLGGCGSSPDGGIPRGAALVVDVDWLAVHLGDPDVQLVDTRAAGYEVSRIPGAIHLRPGDLATTVDGVPSQVAPQMEAQPVLRAAGLRNDVIAVVYGEPPEYDPSRIVWTLRYYRHGTFGTSTAVARPGLPLGERSMRIRRVWSRPSTPSLASMQICASAGTGCVPS